MRRVTSGNFNVKPDVPSQAVTWSISDAFAVLIVTQIGALVWGSVVVTASGHQPGDSLSSWVFFVAVAAVWAGYGGGSYLMAKVKGHGLRADYGAWCRWLDWPGGLVLGVLLQWAVLPVLYAPIMRFVDGDPSQQARELIGSAQGWSDWLLLTVAVAVMAPLVEELFFRGLLLRSLTSRLNPGVAAVISAGVFALVHKDPLVFPGLFVFGLVAASLALWSGRLGGAWALHVGFNLTTLVSLFMQRG